MKRPLRWILTLCGAMSVALVLSGCLFDSSVEELYTLPRLPTEYTELEGQINTILSGGMEYAAPTGGRNIQSVQMVDLDGDDSEEAIAFFRKPSDEKPLKIYIFHANDGVYQPMCVIESSGSAINSIYYRDLNGDGRQEVVVGWKISADVQAVAVYSIAQQPEQLMQSTYSRYTLLDVDQDNIQELVTFRSDSEGNGMAECYGWTGDAFSVKYKCSLSMTMAGLTAGSVVSGYLAADTRALFVTGVSDVGEATTDILVYKAGTGLVNVALDSRTGLSKVVCPDMALKPQDINGDGLIEIPWPGAIFKNGDDASRLVIWRQYDAAGASREVETTYHNKTSGWYFALPDEWKDRFGAISSESGASESAVTFYVDGNPVMAIYSITGENRENRAARGNRVILKRQTATIYAGEMLSVDGYGMGSANMKQSFHLIINEWSTVEN
ncbi:MAG: VCBS repeat-containing protein [Clostridiales bacterium]|nr:VCBS repeat-containing protein [Clostridiales bacterium]